MMGGLSSNWMGSTDQVTLLPDDEALTISLTTAYNESCPNTLERSRRTIAWAREFEVAFHPKVVAMVGVSSKAIRGERLSMRGAGFIGPYDELGFQGRIYPVNPKVTEILGRKAYPTVSAIPEPVDLVIISVPAAATPEVLEDCIVAGAKNIHMFTAGFEETGEPEAIDLGTRIREIAQRGGLRIIGPNCMGLYVPAARIGPFDGLPRESGPVAFLSQSGGHLNWFCHYGPRYGLRFSKGISFGNAYVLDSTDYLEYLATDPETRLICMYLEGVKDGRKLLSQVREICRTKPVIMLKAGLTDAGSRAVASHTASLAGEDAVWAGFFAQTGAVQVSSLEEMAEMAMTFQCLPPPKGKRVAVVVLGGGSSVASADICNREGLDVPVLTEETQNALKEFISLAGASVRNPLDTGAVFRDVSLLQREIELVAADPNIDMVIVRPHIDMIGLAGSGQVDRGISFLSDFARNNPHGKPVALTFYSFSNEPEEAILRTRFETELPNKGVAVYDSLASASRALARYHRFHRMQEEMAAASSGV